MQINEVCLDQYDRNEAKYTDYTNKYVGLNSPIKGF